MSIRILYVIAITIVLGACSSTPPSPDYEYISKNLDEASAVIAGSLVDVPLPIADVFVLVDKIDDKEVSDETVFKKRLLQKVELTPGKHKITVSANQGARTGVYEFTLHAEKGEAYVVRFEVEDHEYGTIWVENYKSGMLATEKTRIKRPLVRSMILVI